MKALDAQSIELLDEAASVLCSGDAQRELLQMVYDLGLNDGKLSAIKEQLGKNAA